MELQDYEKMTDDELIARIEAAKKGKNAIILGHNYQRLEVQKVADFLGDSLELARKAATTDADVVVFCGVDFMAESAKILSPGKTVLLPDSKASCPMAQMVDPGELAEAKRENPDAVVVAYVNTTAEVKALTDICCTSANSVKVIESIGKKEVLFVPDKNLGGYTKNMTGADIKPWDGYCYVHNFLTVKDVERARNEHPGAAFIVHPESPAEVVELADHVFSTSGMARFVEDLTDQADKERGVIIGTEVGLVKQLQLRHPDVNIWPLSEFAVCATMKLTTLPKVCWSIETGQYEISLSDTVIEKARASLERMLDVT